MTKMNLFMYTTQQAGDKDHRNPPQLSAGSVSLCRYAEGIILFRVDGDLRIVVHRWIPTSS